MKTHLDELLALKPATGDSVVIKAAIEAITVKAIDFTNRAAALRAERKESLLKLSGDKLLGLEQKSAELEIAAEQAGELVANLEKQFAEAQKQEALETLIDVYNQLAKNRNGFADRFQNFYANFVLEYKSFMQDNSDIDREAKIHNSNIKIFRERFGGVAYKYEFPERIISRVYSEKVCLPAPGLSVYEYAHVPMAHKGKFWTGEYEGHSPELIAQLKEIDRKAAEVEALNRRSRELPLPDSGPDIRGTSYTVRTPGHDLATSQRMEIEQLGNWRRDIWEH